MVLEIQLTTGRRIWTDSLESHVCRENICIKRCLIFVHPWICIKAKSSDFTLMRLTATKETVAMLRSLTSEARQELKAGTRKRNGRGGRLAGSLLLAPSLCSSSSVSQPRQPTYGWFFPRGLASAASTISQDNAPHTCAQPNCDLGNPPIQILWDFCHLLL